MRRSRSFFFALIFTQLADYQAVSQVFVDARAVALGSATVASMGEFSAFSNAAGLAFLSKKTRSATVSAAFPFFQKDWKSAAASATFSASGSSHFSLAVSKFGLRDFSENAARLAYGRRLLKNLGIGAAIDFSTFRTPETEPNGGISFGLGFFAKPSKWVDLGFFIQNPLENERFDGSPLPVVLRVGSAIRLAEKTRAMLEIEKNLLSPPVFKTGFEHRFSEKLTARTGFRTRPFRFAFGGRLFLRKGFWLDFANESHPVFGQSPAFSLLKNW